MAELTKYVFDIFAWYDSKRDTFTWKDAPACLFNSDEEHKRWIAENQYKDFCPPTEDRLTIFGLTIPRNKATAVFAVQPLTSFPQTVADEVERQGYGELPDFFRCIMRVVFTQKPGAAMQEALKALCRVYGADESLGEVIAMKARNNVLPWVGRRAKDKQLPGRPRVYRLDDLKAEGESMFIPLDQVTNDRASLNASATRLGISVEIEEATQEGVRGYKITRIPKRKPGRPAKHKWPWEELSKPGGSFFAPRDKLPKSGSSTLHGLARNRGLFVTVLRETVDGVEGYRVRINPDA